MSKEYFGAKARDRDFVCSLLGIEPSGREQDWELEFADASRIDEMLSLLAEIPMTEDQRSALALLTLASIDCARSEGLTLTALQIAKAKEQIAATETTRNRMKHFWLGLEQAHDMEMTKKILET